MGPRALESGCVDCVDAPATRCGRCRATQCRAHALAAGTRCAACERDYADEAATRRGAKLIFAPPIAILVGGMLFGALLPITVGGPFGAAVICAIACAAAYAAGAGACRLVERSARAMFMREHARMLPQARLLPARHR